MTELDKAYEPQVVEAKWYAIWLKNNLFHVADKPAKGKKPYTIVIPPPNVTGALHMGHALNHTLQDVLIRWKRMQGFSALWQPGTDHAGIATQNVVERALKKSEGKTRHQIGREALIQKIWDWKGKYGDQILKQSQALGASCDWNRTRFTLDEGLCRAVRECFVTLYEKGLVYRGEYLVNWCPRCRTALADDEVEHKERKGHLWYLRYPLSHPSPSRGEGKGKGKGEGEFIVVATTRPETMLGDTAVAVNPKDKRYKHLVGKKVLLPESHREIPIVADNFVAMEFGTGAVKVTPAHDPNDFQIGERHKLPRIQVMNADATMNENVPPAYRGLTREKCRELLVANLEAQGLIEKIEEHTNAVGHCYRCETIVEFYLSLQWFVKMRPLAQLAIAATKKKQVRFYPARWENFYLQWLENVRDWCISRQIWWGHRIPVWYCARALVRSYDCTQCPPIVSRDAPTQCPKCGGTELKQDEDVLDTWFSSALWPFSTLGWPDKTETLKNYYPTSALVTDRGIIYFWVARMVMMGLTLMKKVPFQDVYIHGTILDGQGQKMSKSKPETCIDPIDIIGRYGADAMRFSLLLLTTEGQDVKLSESKFDMGKHFCNKLWNASRFVLLNLQDYESTRVREYERTNLADRWITSRLQETIQTIHEALEHYHFHEAAQTLYRFVWNEFCDWYLEWIKPILIGPASEEKKATLATLKQTLEKVLRLAHPFLPFITEEIWQHFRPLSPCDAFIVTASYPTTDKKGFDAKAVEEMTLVQSVVTALRNLRGEHQVKPSQKLAVGYYNKNKKESEVLLQNRPCIETLAGLSEWRAVDLSGKPKACATVVSGTTTIFIPFKDLFDVTQEQQRLTKEIEKLQQDLALFEKKMSNQDFVKRAPKEVIEKEKNRMGEIQERLNKLQQAHQQLKGL